ncbi:hypothetical protein BNJ_00366 [Kaumoebavirus]|uniref:hypothetical protein n=1 Tax=Kaumoebavirus TaxID=1859492 RepID=UPI0009C1E9F3|nr:hypothetical protein BNJ_00366 [Kaumoebavirus]ARA72186.1 hypothetical protein BNJ_00366 [Kaumoebavirus]
MISAIKGITNGESIDVASLRKTLWYELLRNGFRDRKVLEYHSNICALLDIFAAEVPRDNPLLDNLHVFIGKPNGNAMELKYGIYIDRDVGNILILLGYVVWDETAADSVKDVFSDFLTAYGMAEPKKSIPRNISITDDIAE